ncbi:metal ABC transporter ATP-binding protein [Weissella confusa]|uniref:metal ABC transporter ATP-binding protein n=1 Tax=Weissella confusa TaxID=1583 RepID=UPI000704C863|nr:metal ABC transporter ATP-binding protein [Weissella confusa]KRN22443.1 ABC transporter ATP-binding protein [Weissella confusa]MBJ7699293.1 metal ABC transporter ATP-binding protein [Weissella confusa]MBS7551469.1 metal ABC transporter ATP-binding protein [Weissella confusa]MCQ8097337.1 metal ABC transporter ATP-binding protein [Weissella confusa]MCQ8146731.1 metal ABC transporter ATP-binding protein [Weissella confusa]
MLSVDHFTVGYEYGPVFTDLSLSFNPNELIGIIGPNGAGKSTLIKAILGIIQPTAGTITYDESPVTGRIRRDKFAYVPQRSDLDLDFPVNVFDLVMMGVLSQISRWHSVGKAEEAIVQNALEKMDIAHLANRSLNELSGGQRQRALVARALVQDADVYLLDEPFVGIDVASEAQIMDALRDLRDAGKTIIIVHHDLSKVANYFDSVILLNHGLLRQGKPEDVMDAATLSEAYGDHLIIMDRHNHIVQGG